MKKAIIFDMYGVLLVRSVLLLEREDTSMTALLTELKETGVKLFLLSNIFVRNSRHYKKRYPFLALFDKLYFSSDIGFTKPDKRAYELVLRENNLQPEDCIFFDDNAQNVQAARALGIDAHVFKDVGAVREVLHT